MAIKVNGTTVINDSRQLQNVASVDATTVAALGAAGVGGGLEEVISTHTVSSAVSTFDISWNNTGYALIKLELINMLPSVLSKPRMRFSGDGGSTYYSTDHVNYAGWWNGSSNNTQTQSGFQGDFDISARYTTNFQQYTRTSGYGGHYLNGSITMMSPGDTTKWTSFQAHMSAAPQSPNANQWQVTAGGKIGPDNTQTNGARYYYDSGNVAAGTIRVIGIKR